ncbi:MAG TPA: hypothetical protein VFO76_03605 [Candidatus Kapabacteria bacterium]|nr:hypothetical protein [Candidatus Kapabacteria bacterium]
MKYLREIAQIVTRYREKNPDLIDNDPPEDDPDQISKLYLALRDGKITTDLDAANYIYGAPNIDTKYTTLKNRLKKKMINLLFFLDIREKDFSEQLVARYHNSKSLFWANTLTTFGARASATKLFESVLQQALHYDFTLNALQAQIFLRNFSRFTGSEKQYDKQDKLIKKLLVTFDYELRAQELYERLTIRFSRSAAEQPELQDIAVKYLEEIEKLRSECDSFTFMLYYFRVKNTVLQVLQKYFEAAETCNEAIDYFDKNSHMSFRVLYGEFSSYALSCYLYLREYEKGNEMAEKCKTLFPEGGTNWFIFIENFFLLMMQTGHFQEAENLYVATVNNPRFQFQPDQVKEKWQLFELYLNFALRQGNIPSIREEHQRIDPNRFLKTIPSFKKDKRGYNVSILIVHILMLIEQNDFGGIIGRMDALRTYRNRYLQVGTKRRSALFFKMLQIMEANSFDPKLTALKSKRYLQQLTTQTSDVVEAQEALQVLPFEWLWETIMKMLEEKQRQGKIQKMT